MSAQPCGCDPEAAWQCREYPNCTEGQATGAQKQEQTRETNPRPDIDGFAGREQAMPTPNERPCIQDQVILDLIHFSIVPHRYQVIEDIRERKQVGLMKYGTLLQPFNGRDALLDAYQEALDLVQYLRQCQEEGLKGVTRLLYEDALRMVIHIRMVIEESHAAQRVTALGDPARCD